MSDIKKLKQWAFNINVTPNAQRLHKRHLPFSVACRVSCVACGVWYVVSGVVRLV